jgi:hypothetical protein
LKVCYGSLAPVSRDTELMGIGTRVCDQIPIQPQDVHLRCRSVLCESVRKNLDGLVHLGRGEEGWSEGDRKRDGQRVAERIKGLARSGCSGRGQHQPRRRENVPGRATGTDAPEGDGGVLVQRFGGGGQGDPSDRGAGKARAATVRHAPSMDDDGWIRCGS